MKTMKQIVKEWRALEAPTPEAWPIIIQEKVRNVWKAMALLPTPTEKVLAEMLSENTGRHFLDSGGVGGRSWERNQQAANEAGVSAVEYWKSTPEATMDRWSVTLSTFHYLADRLEYDKDMDDEYHCSAVGDSLSREPERFARQRGRLWTPPMTFYTYNEESLLSQEIVVTIFRAKDRDGWHETYVIVRTHNGADARGGFSTPRVFRLRGDDEWLTDYDSAVVACDGGRVTGEGRATTYHSWYISPGQTEFFSRTKSADGVWSDAEVEYVDLDLFLGHIATDEEEQPVCPVCGARLHASAVGS